MADTIKEFLISIGYRVDQGSQQRFTASTGAANAQVVAMQKSLNAAAAALINLGKQFQAVAGDPTKKIVEAADKIKKRNEDLRKGVQELGRFAVGTATIFAAGVREVAKNYEQLYYISQRTGASVESLTNLKFAFQQIGLGGDEAVQAISNFSRTLRDFPGKGVLLRNLIRPEDVEYVKKNFGSGLDAMTANFEAFIHRLSQISDPWLRTRYAEAFGISGDLADRLVKNEEVRAKAFQEHAEALKRVGLNQKELEDESVKFIQNLNRLWENVSLIFQKSAHEAMPYLNTLTAGANDFIKKVQEFDNLHPGAAMAEGIGAAAAAYLGLAAVIGSLTGNFLGLKAAAAGALAVIRGMVRLVPRLGPVGAFVAGMTPKPAGEGEDEALRKQGGHPLTGPGEEAPKTWSGVWAGIKGLFPHFQGGGIVRADLHHGEAVLPAGLTSMLMRASASGGGDRGIVTVLENILAGFEAWWFGSAAYRPFVVVKRDEIGGDAQFASDLAQGPRLHGDPLGLSGRHRSGSGGAVGPLNPPSGGSAGGAWAQRASALYEYATKKLGIDSAHALAMLANEKAESTFNPNAVGAAGEQGSFQWDRSRWAALQRSLGPRSRDLFAQFAYAVEEMKKRSPDWFKTPGSAASLTQQWEHLFERPRVETGRLRQLQDVQRNVTINQNNTVHVQHGDPLGGQEIGRHVLGAHRRMAGDLVRSFRTALA